MQKNIWVRTALAAAMLAGSGATMAEVTGNVAVVSDYVFDGVSQTDNGPALQGGIDWAADSGLYVGAWASNVDLGDAGIEFDVYGGFTFGSEAVSFDIGAVQYMYDSEPNDLDEDGIFSDSGDYFEIYAGVTFDENLTLKYWYADDYFGLGYASARLKASFELAINDDWSVPLEYTFTDPDEGDSYNHYKVALATSFGDINAELSYQMTDFDHEGDEQLSDWYYTDGGFVLSLGMDF